MCVLLHSCEQSTLSSRFSSKKFKAMCNISEIKSLYLAFVRPIVEYASVIWSPYTNCDKTVLEGVQHKAARFVCNDFSTYSSVTSMLNNLKWTALLEYLDCDIRNHGAQYSGFLLRSNFP